VLCDFSLVVDKPENQVYQTQENVYQLLRYDGKSNAHGQWEPPAYQGLAKGTSEGNWGEGEVYTNPSMYQDLTTNAAASNADYLPAYHPLMKSTVCDSIPIKFCLIGYVQCIDILTWTRGFRVKIAKFLLSLNSQKRLGYKENNIKL